MKKKALYYSVLNYSKVNLDYLKKKFDLIIFEYPDFSKKKILKEIEVIFAPLGYYLDKKKISICKNLKLIISNTTSDTHIDTKFAKKKNIKIITLKDSDFLNKITPTAEHTLGIIIALTRNYINSINYVKQSFWDRKYFAGQKMLSRSKVGIIGLGRLGLLVSKYLENIGCLINYYDPYKNINYPNFKKFKSLSNLIKNSDIISLHLHPLKNGKPLLNNKILNYFNKSKFLINTSRGELVDEKALCELLKRNKLGGYAADVLKGEFKPNFDLNKNLVYQLSKKNNKVLIFPHIGGSTIDAWHETQKYVLEKAVSFLNRSKSKNYKILKNNVWALVTARGGSKSIPLKNLALLNNKRLIEYTFDIINKNNDVIKKTFCSSDHKQIEIISKKNNIEFIQRPKKLCGDNISSKDVVKNFLNTIFDKHGHLPEYIFLFEPTSPFVRSKDIKKIYSELKKNKNFDSSQTVTKVSSNSHAYNQRYHSQDIRHKDIKKSDFYFSSKRFKAVNKQSKPNFFIHGNLRLFRTLSFLKYEDFFGKLSLPVEIPKIYAFDVDDKYDLRIAEALIKTNQIKIS